MAPEQIRGKDIAPQTDLYALGCVFFELLAGRPPFVGETAAEILHQHIKEPAPRVGQFAPDCPAALEQLVFDLLQKDPTTRPADAETVARRLQGVTQTITVKPNLRPFEQTAAVAPPPVSLKDTKSAPVISSVASNRIVVLPRWVWFAGIGTLALLLVLVFSLLSQRSSADEKAEELWLAAFREDNVPVQIVAAKALGQLANTSESANQVLLETLENPPDNLALLAAVVSAVGEAGYSAKSAVTTLQKLAQTHSEPSVRNAAMAAMDKLKDAKPRGRSIWFYLNALAVLAALGAAGYVAWKLPA
jgi:serine/threonine protein kinase